MTTQPLNEEQLDKLKNIEEELERWRYNEKIRDILIGFWALLVIISITSIIIWSKLI